MMGSLPSLTHPSSRPKQIAERGGGRTEGKDKVKEEYGKGGEIEKGESEGTTD